MNAINLNAHKLLGFRLSAMSSSSAVGAKVGDKGVHAVVAGAKMGAKDGAKTNPAGFAAVVVFGAKMGLKGGAKLGGKAVLAH